MGLQKGRKKLFRSRSVVLTERDEIAFSRVLREFYPDIWIVGSTKDDDKYSSSHLPSIPHAISSHISFILPSPGQEKRWQLNLDMQSLLIHPTCRFNLERSNWEWWDTRKKWAFDNPLLGWGKLSVAFPRDDPDQVLKKFSLKLLRLVNKVCWKNGHGLDACIWSQTGGAERRGLGGGGGIDPKEDIKLNKYYDDSQWDDELPTESTLQHVKSGREPKF